MKFDIQAINRCAALWREQGLCEDCAHLAAPLSLEITIQSYQRGKLERMVSVVAVLTILLGAALILRAIW